MDVGLVCDGCRTFHPMGARACERCGASLSLDESAPASASVQAQAGARGGPPAPVAAPGGPVVSGGGVGVATPGVTRTCPACSTELPAANRFCGSCGTQMPEETRPSASAPDLPAMPTMPAPAPGGGAGDGKRTLFFGAMQAARAKLVLIKGDGLDGVSYTLAGQEHVAGRDEGADLPFLDDPFMSPEHVNFFYREGKLAVRDESRQNGIYIRIRGSRQVEFGDRFLVGEQVLELGRTPEDVELRPTADGTYFYTSPRGPSHFRVVQLLRGGDTGLAFRAQSDVVSLGREGNDINFPDDPFISGHHAQVSFSNGALTLTDLGSKNGTFLRVNSEAMLEHGDYVFMGQQLLRVEIV